MTHHEWQAHLHQALGEVDFLEAMMQTMLTELPNDPRRQGWLDALESLTVLRETFEAELDDAP
jgi:hypothetical protein